MLQSIVGYGYPPRCGLTNKVKLLPSHRTTYAGGNKKVLLRECKRHMPAVYQVLHLLSYPMGVGGYPISGQGYPIPGQGVPHLCMGVPHPWPGGYTPSWPDWGTSYPDLARVPSILTWPGYPPGVSCKYSVANHSIFSKHVTRSVTWPLFCPYKQTTNINFSQILPNKTVNLNYFHPNFYKPITATIQYS